MIQFSKGVQKGFRAGTNIWQTPLLSPKLSFLLFPASLPQTSNTLTFSREKNTSFDSILQRLYLQKIWKKSHFLADSSVWNRSQESCFWFMLNCTLNTEQYSCAFFILFTLHLLHIHTYRMHTHPPTLVSKNLYPPVPNIQLTHTASRETPSFNV